MAVSEGQRSLFLTELGTSMLHLAEKRGQGYGFTETNKAAVEETPVVQVQESLSQFAAARYGAPDMTASVSALEWSQAAAEGVVVGHGQLYVLHRTHQVPFYFVISNEGIAAAERLQR